jgi:hypothetical protein
MDRLTGFVLDNPWQIANRLSYESGILSGYSLFATAKKDVK